LQFVIESQLDRCHDPVSRLNCMIALFWEGVERFERTLRYPEQTLAARNQRQPAQVLPLRRPERLH
jgi:hypothetical protein